MAAVRVIEVVRMGVIREVAEGARLVLCLLRVMSQLLGLEVKIRELVLMLLELEVKLRRRCLL